jgi:hypothetical protein
MRVQALFLISLVVCNQLRAQESLNIAIVGGAANRLYVDQKVRVDPVVEVDDDQGKPVEGASVIFTLPARGPSGSFESGGQELRVITDAKGRAAAHGMRANKLKGSYEITVNASYEGRTGTAKIEETNVKAPRSGGAFGVSTRTWVFLALGALAIAGGIIAAKELKGGANPNVLTATPGVPVVGGPK